MTAIEREIEIESEIRSLFYFYRSQGNKSDVSIFAEDYDFLLKRKKIFKAVDGSFFGAIKVKRGPRKKKARRKRPPDMFV